MGRFLELFLVDIINNLILRAKKNGRNRIKKKDLDYLIKKKKPLDKSITN
jgi:histone H3/H4